MIDLTPLDVRKKRGDFRRVLRGYDPQEVDSFLELVAERFEDLVKENLTLKERSQRLESQVNSQEGREKAVQQALVTAQELREEIQTQAKREADFLKKEAEQEIDRIVGDARRRLTDHESALDDLRRRRLQFLKQFKGLLTKELEMVELEEERATAAAEPLEIDLSGGWRAEAREKAAEAVREPEEGESGGDDAEPAGAAEVPTEPAAGEGPSPEAAGEDETPEPANEPPGAATESGAPAARPGSEPPEPAAKASAPEAEAPAPEAKGSPPEAEAAAPEAEAAAPEAEAAAPEAEAAAREEGPGADAPEASGAEGDAGADADAEGPAASTPDEPLWLSSLLREGEERKSRKEKGEEGG